MGSKNLISLVGVFFFSLNLWAATSTEVKVMLSPGGHFIAKTNSVSGKAKKVGNKVIAEDISLDLTTLTTEIELRDKHLKEKLETDKFPKAVLKNAVGENGEGTATIELKGKEIKVKGPYQLLAGNELKAEFEVSLADLDITGIKYLGLGVKDKVTVTVYVPVTE